ncbi:hypothetical protein [Marinibacterium sp. SX1]|uniref:hypothetical protein n=1 Tax=Marinibacterium sp. SX1 TaxID=3388424 RepID=UPI003D170AD5
MGIAVTALAQVLTPLLGAQVATAIATAFVNLATTLVLTSARAALSKRPGREDQARELQRYTGLPQVRHAYGNTEAPGTPAPADMVIDGVLYGCWIVNSRPSEGPFALYLDGREVELSGDPYDFTEGGGALATNEPFSGYLRVWIGIGDQTSPPFEITDEAGFIDTDRERGFKVTDGWQGRTVVWMRADRGPSEGRTERWPSAPPAVALRGPFSKLWDPRDPAQDPDDPATWEFSDNQALVVLDALRQNPVSPYDLTNLIVATFEAAADVADENVPLKDGGSEARYRAAGVLVYSAGDVEDQLDPLNEAGATSFFQAGGRMGILPGAWLPSEYTLTDTLGDAFEYRKLRGDERPYSHVRTTYTSADREYETSDLGQWPIPGVTAAVRVFDHQCDFVESGTQAQRLRKIKGLRLTMEREIEGTAPPDMIEVLAGATITAGIAGMARTNGTYQLLTAHPALDPLGIDDGVAARVPFEARETAEAIYAWVPADDETDIVVPPFEVSYSGTAPPGSLSVISGPAVDVNTGDSVIQRVRFAFEPSASASVTHYEWTYVDWSDEGDGLVVSGGSIPASQALDTDGRHFGYLSGFSPFVETEIAVWAVGPAGQSSAVSISGVRLNFDVTINSASGGAGVADFNVTAPTNSVFAGVVILRSDDDVIENAVEVYGLEPMDSGQTDVVQATGLAAGAAYFWVAPVSTNGTRAPAAGPEYLTIT